MARGRHRSTPSSIRQIQVDTGRFESSPKQPGRIAGGGGCESVVLRHSGMSHVGLVGIWQRATGVACLSFLWLSYVSGRAWEGIPAAAASCQDLEALLHDPTVTRISIIGVIVVRDCTWRNVPIPGR